METPSFSRRLKTQSEPLTDPQITRRPVLGKKFMQTLDDHVYKDLARFAEQRGVTIQGLIRAVIIPEWITSQVGGPITSISQLVPSQYVEARAETRNLAPSTKNPLLIQR